MTARQLLAVGYHTASTPGGPVFISELNRLRGYLQEIEQRLQAGFICNNTDLDRFGDPYLRDPHGLTKDILEKMQHVVIYTRHEFLPTAYQATSKLCEPKNYGSTATDQSWVGICLAHGADAMTLLHELYHYSAASDPANEDKAYAISNWSSGCFA